MYSDLVFYGVIVISTILATVCTPVLGTKLFPLKKKKKKKNLRDQSTDKIAVSSFADATFILCSQA